MLKSFSPSEIVCVVDNVAEAQAIFLTNNLSIFYCKNKGNCRSFRLSVELAPLHPSDIYYFVENDHLHLSSQKSFDLLDCSDLILLAFTIILINTIDILIRLCSVWCR